MTTVTETEKDTVEATITDYLVPNKSKVGFPKLKTVELTPQNRDGKTKSAKVRWKNWHKLPGNKKRVEVVLDQNSKVISWREISGPTLLVRKAKDALALKRGKRRTVHKDHVRYTNSQH